MEKTKLLLSISWPHVARASVRTKHLSLKCQDGFSETLSLDRGTVLMAAVSRQCCFLLRAATKGMSCCVLNGKPWDIEDCDLCTPPPQSGRILRNLPRLLEPVGRDFERSEVMHNPSSSTGLLGVQTAHSVLGQQDAIHKSNAVN